MKMVYALPIYFARNFREIEKTYRPVTKAEILEGTSEDNFFEFMEWTKNPKFLLKNELTAYASGIVGELHETVEYKFGLDEIFNDAETVRLLAGLSKSGVELIVFEDENPRVARLFKKI